MLTPDQLFGILAARPYPGSVDLRMSSGACCFTVEHVAVGYNINGWVALGRVIPAEWTIPGDFLSDAARVHAEIARVLALVEPADLRAQLTKMTDAHAVVSQRLVGAQREVAERDAIIDELRAALETIAAHVGLVGSDQWALDEIKGKVAKVATEHDALAAALTWEGMEALYPADLVERARRMASDAAQHLLDREFIVAAHDARDRLAAYLGMDGAGFVQIVEAIERGGVGAVKGSCTTKDGQGDLLSRHNAPVKIGDRTLSPAERAAFVIRRLTRAAQNARAEAAALRAEQEEIAEALGDAPTYAEHADGSLVGLNLVERVRARLT